MKKLLALVLALVMTLGLATVGSNAAVDTELKDADKIADEFQEAVTVVKAIDVMVGDDEGNFRPQDKLTRAEGAKIVAYLNATNKVAADLVGSGNKFSDVPATHWAAGMVEYCAVNKILDGVGGGKFDPSGELKVVAFAKLMLTSLGYDSVAEGYVNNADWATHVMTRAQRVGLLKGLSGLKPTDVITREQAAQMLYNTLKSPIVEYDQKLYTNDGNVLVGSSNAKPVTNEEKGKQTIFATRVNAQQNANGAYVVEYAEQYYPQLVLTKSEDDFGRPANVWTYARNELGVYPDKDLFVTSWTEDVKGSTIYDAIGALAYSWRNLDYSIDIYVDGVNTEWRYWNGSGYNTSKTTTEIAKIAKDGTWMGNAGQGVLAELYVDDDNESVRIVYINTWLAEAQTDYASASEKIVLGVYENKWDAQISRDAYLDDDNKIEDLKVGDMVLVTMINPGTDDYEIKSVVPAEVSENAYASAYTTKSNNYMNSITVDGEKISVAAQANWKEEILKDYSLEKLKNFTYDVWFDTYGNIIGIDYNTQDTNFVFVVGLEAKSTYLAYTTYSANLIFLDGSMKTATVTVNKNGSAKTVVTALGAGSPTVNAWFTYSTDEAGNIILNDLVPTKKYADTKPYPAYQSAQAMADNANFNDIDASHTTLDATKTGGTYAYGNDKSVYITTAVDTTAAYAKGGGAIKEVLGVSVGIKNTAINPSDAGTKMNTLSNFNGTNANNAANNGTVLQTAALKLAKTAQNNNNTFFLYSKNGYVIAAVVIGEDAGASRNFVYVISGPTQRQYDNRYLDTYKVIKDGKITTIDVDTQKSNTTALADKLAEKKMHCVVYDKDGIVIDVKNTPGAGLGEIVNTSLDTSTNKKNGYTYTTVSDNGDVVLDGNTLVIKTENDNACYILVGEDCKYFVWNPSNSTFETYNTAKAALSMAKANENGSQRYIQSIASVITGTTGFANTVIFYDLYTEVAAKADPTGINMVDGTWSKGNYGTTQFYTKDGHDITFADAAAKLQNQMKSDGCTNITVTTDAGGKFIVSYTYGGVSKIEHVADLDNYKCNQVYKVTFIDSTDKTKNATAYSHESANVATEANLAAKTVAADLKKVNSKASFKDDGTDTVAIMRTYDSVLVTDSSTTNYAAWQGGKGAVNYDVTVVKAGDQMAAINGLLASVDEVNIVKSVFAPGAFTNLTVPADHKLTLNADDGDLLILDTDTTTVKGTLNGVVATGKTAEVRPTNEFVNDGGKLTGKLTISCTKITLKDSATGTVETLDTPTLTIGCNVTVANLKVDKIILKGDTETSSLTVTKKLTDKSGTGVDIDFGVGTAAYAMSVTLPKDGKAVIDDVNYAKGADGTITDAKSIGDVTVADGAKVKIVDSGSNTTEVTSFKTDTDANGVTFTAQYDASKVSVDKVTATNTKDSVTLPTGTENKDGNKPTVDGDGAKNVSGTATEKVWIKLAASGSSAKNGNGDETSTYYVAGDTITVKFADAVKGTPSVGAIGKAEIQSSDKTLVTITLSAKINIPTTITLSGLTLETVPTGKEETTDKTITIKLPALKDSSKASTPKIDDDTGTIDFNPDPKA